MIKVRNCPSPTGNLHIGTLRTALYNYLFAKKNGGKIIFRSEDTDKERSEKKFEENIISGLANMGIGYDEGPFRQSERTEIYKKYLEKLLESGDAYYCFMTKEELEEIRETQMANKEATRYPNTYRDFSLEKAKELLAKGEKAVIRLKLPEKEIIFDDLIKGEIKIHTKELGGDMVIAKDLETPLYNFTVVIDDFEMGVSHVIRGEDHISNTPKQICIYEKIGAKIPEFAHLPLILNEDRTKLSKRKNKVSVNDFLEEGYLKEALLNFIALIGWSAKTEQEFFTLEELVEKFSFEGVSKSGAIFDLKKLDFINSHYIKNLNFEELSEKISPFLNENLQKIKNENGELFLKILKFSQERLKKLSDINSEIEWFLEEKSFSEEFKNTILFNEKMGINENSIKEILENLKEFINGLEDGFLEGENYSEEILKGKIIDFIKSKDSKNGTYMWPLRACLSRTEKSPSPFEMMNLLGKNGSLEKIEGVLEKI